MKYPGGLHFVTYPGGLPFLLLARHTGATRVTVSERRWTLGRDVHLSIIHNALLGVFNATQAEVKCK